MSIANKIELSATDILSNSSLRVLAGLCEKLHCSPEILCDVLEALICGLSKNINVEYDHLGSSTNTHGFKVCILPSGTGKTLAVEFGLSVLEMVNLAEQWRGLVGSGTVLSKMSQITNCTGKMALLMSSEGLKELNNWLDGDTRIVGREARAYLLCLHDGSLCERCQRRNMIGFRFRNCLHICAVGTEHGLLEYYDKSQKTGEDGISSRVQISLFHE